MAEVVLWTVQVISKGPWPVTKNGEREVKKKAVRKRQRYTLKQRQIESEHTHPLPSTPWRKPSTGDRWVTVSRFLIIDTRMNDQDEWDDPRVPGATVWLWKPAFYPDSTSTLLGKSNRAMQSP